MRKFSKVSLVILLTYFLSLFNFGFGINPGSESATANSKLSFVKKGQQEKYQPGELIVKYKEEAKDKEATSKRLKATVAKKGSLGTEMVRLPEGVSVEEAMKAYLEDPNVEYAHPNYAYQIAMVPNDTHYGSQWNLPNIKAEKAWDITRGAADITIAIVDTGVDLGHPDLQKNIVEGWNFIADNSVAQDDFGHGTHVAGIAAGVSNNKTGIAGLAGKAKIMPVKVLNANGGGYESDVVEGIIWAVDHGADIINLSLTTASPSETMQEAVDYAYHKGVLVVAAAGNEGSAEVSYPAKFSSVMAVAATDEDNSVAFFSNYGPEIEVSAPGVNILSTVWFGESTYFAAAGTSMASPHVAGLAALVWSLEPTLTNTEVREIIKSSADDLGPAGFDDKYGKGKINAYKAVCQATKLADEEAAQ